MAGYHYKLQLIPRVSGSIDDKDYWEHEQPAVEMLSEYRKLLPNDNAWDETEEFRSKANLSVLYVWWDEEKVLSVMFEYAPEDNVSDELLNSVLRLCKKYGYFLYSEETKSVIAPSKNDLWQDFQRCRPYKFNKDRLNEFLSIPSQQHGWLVIKTHKKCMLHQPPRGLDGSSVRASLQSYRKCMHYMLWIHSASS